MYDNNNIFAKILRKEAPAQIIFENEIAIAFPTIQPKAKTHILIIPKQQYINYSDFIQKANHLEVVSFFQTIAEVAKFMHISSYRLLTNNGKEAGQEVFHFHIHLMSDN